MATHLLIVAWDRPDLWDYWRRWFSGVEGILVILDRRRGERRRMLRPHEPERRRGDRRRQSIDDQLRDMGIAIVRPQ